MVVVVNVDDDGDNDGDDDDDCLDGGSIRGHWMPMMFYR